MSDIVYADFPVGGQSWRALLVPSDDPRLRTSAGEACYGLTVEAECVIYLSNELRGDALAAYFLHELEHAVNAVSGFDSELSDAVSTADEYERLDERLVRFRNPVWHAVLKWFGLTLPEGPTE